MTESKCPPRHGTARLLWEAGKEADDPDEAEDLARTRGGQEVKNGS